jgi:hypothetical protein
MDSKHDRSGMYAPGVSYDGAARLPGSDGPANQPTNQPKLDEHVVQSESREEMVRGERILAMPSLPPHGDQHFRLDYVIGAHLKTGYVGSTDMLTRSSVESDFATDTCVRKTGIDPATNERYLEEVAFEVVYEQSLRDITIRAEDLTKCGVRRIFSIFVKKRQVCEWSPASKEWIQVRPDTLIEDPCFATPLTADALLDAAAADDSVARALLGKKNRVLEKKLEKDRKKSLREGRKEGRKEGREEGHVEGVRIGVLQTEQRIILVIAEKSVGRPLSSEHRKKLQAYVKRFGFDRVHNECSARPGLALMRWLDESEVI